VLAGQRQVNVAVLSSDCGARVAAARRVTQLTPWARRDIGLTAAAVFQCERDPATSLAVIEPALAINPYNLNLLLLASARQLRGGAPDRADDLARRAIEVEPQLGRAWLLLAMAQDARGDMTSAGASCENALRWYRSGPEAQTYCSNRTR
jgi:tetratricopeptide (TPR) repeat protein